MRRGSSTVVALVGDIGADLLGHLSKPSNVSVLEPPAQSLEASFETFSQAGRRLTTYAVVAADPLGQVAEEWQKMWTVGGADNQFEERAGEAILAWRSGRLEMPDYYVVVLNEPVSPVAATTTKPHQHDFHLGVLRSERPKRVAEVVAAEAGETAARILQTLAQLPQGPWWPAVDRLIESVRSFFPGQLAIGTRTSGISIPEQASADELYRGRMEREQLSAAQDTDPHRAADHLRGHDALEVPAVLDTKLLKIDEDVLPP